MGSLEQRLQRLEGSLRQVVVCLRSFTGQIDEPVRISRVLAPGVADAQEWTRHAAETVHAFRARVVASSQDGCDSAVVVLAEYNRPEGSDER